MALNRQRAEERSIDEHRTSEANTSSTDEIAAISELTRWTDEMMVIRALQRFIGPIFIPIFRPLICQLVKDQLAKQKILISMLENPENQASSSVLQKLKLQFMNRIALPVFTGMPLLGENQTPIEIALVDAISGEIVITGDEAAAKLEIMGFRVDDDDDENDNGTLTYEDLQKRILSGRNGRRILQGNTRLQLKEGFGFVHKISFTHNSGHTRNGFYRLVAVVVDAALMNRVEVAWTETFVMKDRRCTYHEKHLCPSLSDKVYHLQQISYNGARYKRLKDAKVYTVNDLLRLLYTDPKQLEDILDLKASSKFWDDIVKHAQSSNAMFLYLDPQNELKTGVVLDVKLQLKAVIVEPHLCIAVNQLSEQQKVETQELVKFASEHIDMLHSFDHEASLEEYLQSGTSLPLARMTDGPPRPSSQVTKASHSVNYSNHKPTTQSERGKEKVPFDDEMISSTNDYQEYVPFHLASLKSTNALSFGPATDPSTSSQTVESLHDTLDINDPMLNESLMATLLNDICGMLNESPNECQSNPAIISLCNIAGARWKKVSKLLRRNSVRERISLSQGIQPLKKQRCF